MTQAAWIALSVLAALGVAIVIEAYLRRNRPRRPLSRSQPKPRVLTEKVELGQEATDQDMVERAHEKNSRKQRDNDALNRRN